MTEGADDWVELLEGEPPCRQCLHDEIHRCAQERFGYPAMGRLCAGYDALSDLVCDNDNAAHG